jgi:replicative DNA helicase
MSDMHESNEAKIICQMLLDNSIIPSLTLTEEHFTDHLCRKAYGEIQRQYSRHGGASKDCLLDIGLEYQWISDVLFILPTAANFSFFEKKIKAAYQKEFERRLVQHSVDILEGRAGGKVVEYLEKEITEFSASVGEFKDSTLQDVLYTALEDIEARAAKGGELPGITTGILKLNAMIHGFEDRQYYIIGARPSDGKTAFGTNCVLAAARAGKKVGFITAESSVKEVGRRIYAQEAKIDASRIAMGNIDMIDAGALTDAGARLNPRNVVFYDEPNPTIETVERKAREWKRRNWVEIIFLDYIQIIQGGRGDSFHERLADVSLRIKALARKLEIPMVCMAQLTRGAADRKPMESDIAGTDQITRDADGIILIHHERNDQNEIEYSQLIVAKARDGKKGICNVKFHGEFLSFEGR